MTVITANSPDKAKRARYNELKRQGVSHEEIERELGWTHISLIESRKAAGLPAFPLREPGRESVPAKAHGPTLTDLFCGAGGSSSGAVAAGVRVRMAANHWQLACDIHNANHPDTDHATKDLHEEQPSYFPRTDILWASPECTKWSKANGGRPLPSIEEGLFEDPLSDEAAQRSRLLMFDVLRFAEFHRYRAMVIENVVDIATREKYRLAWKVWQADLMKLGYEYRVVSLNSMHAQALGPPAPQSRDRLYIVCWRRGDRAPDIDRYMSPRAWCKRCAMVVESRQAFKPGRTVGCYGAQYVYIHPACGTRVEPAWLPAAAAIDWSIPGTPIGERPIKDFYDKKGNFLGRGHLAPKTKARIVAGIAKYWRPIGDPLLMRPYTPRGDAGRSGQMLTPVTEVARTLTASARPALLVPMEGRERKEARPAALPSRAQTTRQETAVVAPPLHVSLMGGDDSHVANSARPVTQELRTITAEGNNDYLLAPYYGSAEAARPVTDPIGTLTTHDRYGLVTPAGGTWNDQATSTDEALRTLTTRDAYALITRHFSSNGDGAEMTTPVWEAMRTLTTGNQSIITPGDLAAAEAQYETCNFRMITPTEVAAGMAFPASYDWAVRDAKGRLPSNRNLVRMAGNAVTPPAARDMLAAVVEALGGEVTAA